MASVVRSSQDSPPALRRDADTIVALLRDRLGDDVVDAGVAYGQATVTVKASALERAARLCKQDHPLDMDFFDMMAGVDLGEEGFAVVTRLYSTRYRHEVLLRAVAEGGRDEPRLPTLTGVYRGADWHERETYDMFGIVFEGHPGLEPRILTVENFEGWPLRKEFLLTTREVKPWPGLKEPKEEPAEGADGEGTASGPTAEEKAAAAKAKAERAKRKAAEMRAKKAAERAAAQQQEGGEQPEQAVEGGGTADGSAQAASDSPDAEDGEQS